MSPQRQFKSLPIATAAILLAIVLGGMLFAVTIALVAVGDPLGGPVTGALALGSALGFVVLTVGLCRVVRRLARAGRDDTDAGGEGGGGLGSDPEPPQLPSGEPDWWPQFERDLRAYLEARERVPVAG